jgi:penicillin-binding protein 1A
LAAFSLGLLSWLAAASYEEVVNKFSAILGLAQVVGLLVLAIVLFSWLAIIYFSELQRSLVYAARKVIVLRRMLGVNYGRVELVLPSRRIEGADDPFSISMFPGWGSYKCFPIYLITIVSAFFFILIVARYNTEIGQYIGILGVTEHIATSGGIPYFVALVWICLALGTYRRKLADSHENILLCVARGLGQLTRISVVRAVEPVIYRARLAVFEAERLKVPLDRFFSTIMCLEDRRFFRHWGVSLAAIASAIWRYAKTRKLSGGSTITQQLARSLFLTRLRPAVLRKPIELVLALWLECFFNKIDILKMYVCSVRYEKDVLGVSAAIGHFFSRKPSDQISNAEIFFLCERIANVKSKLLSGKIAANVDQLRAAGLLRPEDLPELICIYEKQVSAGKVSEAREGSLLALKKLWTR